MNDLDCCRECGHFAYLHSNPNEPKYTEQRIFQHDFLKRCDPQNDHGCDCQEFIPEDNLDYIEYLAKKRGLLE